MEKRKISLTALYKEKLNEPTPAKNFIDQLSAITDRSELTVRLWVGGHHKPEPLIQRIIADSFNLDIDYLFPEPEPRKRRKRTCNK